MLGESEIILMNRKSLIAILGYIVVTFALAYPWHFVWFKDLIHDLGIYNKEEPNFALGVASLLIQGAVMAYLYPFFKRAGGSGGHYLKQGVKFGLLMGAFLFSVSTLANAAKIEVTSIPTWVLIQFCFHGLQFTLAGVVIGWASKES